MQFGAHVRTFGGMTAALARGEAMGCEVVQIFTQNPRAWRVPSRHPEGLAAYRARQAESGLIKATFCHAPYLINLGSPSPEMREHSSACLVANLETATAIEAAGLLVHLGSHRGRGLETCLDDIARRLRNALDGVEGSCPILLENAAGAGGTIGRSLEELARVVARLGGDRRLGVCLDTQHLWASGISFATPDEVERLLDRLDAVLGMERLSCLHLNDSQVDFGGNRDRHDNLGLGRIGPSPLRAFLGHPRLQGLPVVLEVPGLGGRGPDAADLVLARRLHVEGRSLYRSPPRGSPVSDSPPSVSSG